MAVPRDEQIGRIGQEQRFELWIVTPGMPSDMGDPHPHALQRKAVVQGKGSPYPLIVDVAVDRAQGLQPLQGLDHSPIADITGMPYLIDIAGMSGDFRPEVAMRIGQQQNPLHRHELGIRSPTRADRWSARFDYFCIRHTKKGFLRYFLQVSFNGTHYHGWQIQPQLRTVQQVLNDRLSKLLRQPIAVVGAGRTDAGVHARCMVAHFDVTSSLERADFLYKINAFLPPDLAVRDIRAVSSKAHARFSALSRTYRYYIKLAKDPFQVETAYLLQRAALDLEKMNEAAALLSGHEDFSSFARSGSDTAHNNCEIKRASWSQRGEQLVFEVTANRFLRNMVRALVGTLLEVGMKKCSPARFEQIILRRDRREAAASAPARGLFLEAVHYPEAIYG